MFDWIRKLLTVKQSNELVARRVYVLNVLIMGTIGVNLAALILMVVRQWRLGNEYKGESLWLVILVLGLFLFVYYLSRRGRLLESSILFLAAYLSLAVLIIVKAGLQNPTALLIYALLLTLSAILYELKYLFYIFAVILLSYFVLLMMQIEGTFVPNLEWRMTALDMEMGVGYVIIPVVIGLVSYLYNREITKSLERALESEAELKRERDLLELRVEQRTKDLKKAQLEQITQLSKLAVFGKNTIGLLHDLVNPLTAISLNLKQVDRLKSDSKNFEEVSNCSTRALKAARKLEDYIYFIKDQVTKKERGRWFAVGQEVDDVIKFFEFKLKRNGIGLEVEIEDDLEMFGDPVRFDQVVGNLMSNAIEALEEIDKEDKMIKIRINKFDDSVNMIIADNGRGIKKKDLARIFENFYSTKKGNGNIGAGLAVTKAIVEDDFGGLIKVESSREEGTVFYISFKKNNSKV